MKNNQAKRWRLFADLPVQGGLLIRVFLYWVVSHLAVLGTVALFCFISNGEGSITSYLWPACIVSFLVLPMLMLEMVKFSNRFAGPIVNISKNLKRLADHETVESVRFRPGDFWGELSENLNKVIADRIENSPTAAASSTNPNSGSGLQHPAKEECHV